MDPIEKQFNKEIKVMPEKLLMKKKSKTIDFEGITKLKRKLKTLSPRYKEPFYDNSI